MKKSSRNELIKLCIAAMLLALCLVLPFLTGQIQQIGKALAPMHLPVLICGFICGWKYGAAVGFTAPLLRFLLFGMPPIFPSGIAMAFELCTYGLLTGILFAKLPKKIPSIFISLIVSMLAGRVIWGIASYILASFANTEFSFPLFLSGAFTSAIPGIILQIVLVPLVVIALRKAKFIAQD